MTEYLFKPEEIPTFVRASLINKKGLNHPVWTENKARLIAEYIRLFTFVTKHGAYIDGFAAPQERDRLDMCSANLVLATEPKRVREFWLCDKSPHGITILNQMQNDHAEKGRTIHVLPGDFNVNVDQILQSGRIGQKTATFALLDQRTFECEWETVQKLAAHKTTMKIELFYFFATGWIDRSIAAVKRERAEQRVARWWGRDDWKALQGMEGIARANLLVERFKGELGYAYAIPYAIHNQHRGGRTMYHMIHATDHVEATPLMLRAYRKVSGRRDWDKVVTQQDWLDHYSSL